MHVNRKAWLFSLGASFCVATIVFVCLPSRSRLVGLQFETKSFDMGSGRPGEILSGQLRLHNPESRPIHVLSVEKSCGCTSFSPEPPFAVPSKAWLTLEWQVRLPSDLGSRAITFSLHTNETEHPATTVTALVNVAPTEYVQPGEISFGEVPHGVGGKVELGVYSTDGSLFPRDDLEIIASNLESVQVLPNNSSTKQFVVVLSKEAALGSFDSSIRIRVCSLNRILEVPIRVMVLRGVTIIPGTLIARTSEAESGATVAFHARRVDRKPLLHVERISSVPERRFDVVSDEPLEANRGLRRIVLALRDESLLAHSSAVQVKIWFANCPEPAEAVIMGR